jgi:hypothetical protein
LELLFDRLLDDEDLDLLELPEDLFTLDELLREVLEDLTLEEELDLETFPLLLDVELDLFTPEELLFVEPEDLLTLEELLLFDPELLVTLPEDLLLELLDPTFPELPLLLEDPLERTLELLLDLLL